MAERLGLSVARVQQFEYKTFDPRYSTLVRFRDALYEIIDEVQRRDAEEFAKRLRLVESDPKNAWLLEAYKKEKAYRRAHKLEWVKAKTKRYQPNSSTGTEASSGTTNSSAESSTTNGSSV